MTTKKPSDPTFAAAFKADLELRHERRKAASSEFSFEITKSQGLVALVEWIEHARNQTRAIQEIAAVDPAFAQLLRDHGSFLNSADFCEYTSKGFMWLLGTLSDLLHKMQTGSME